jgi:hypothetical protein
MSKPSRQQKTLKIVAALEALADLAEAIQPHIVRIIVSAIFFYGLYRVAIDVFKAHAQ